MKEYDRLNSDSFEDSFPVLLVQDVLHEFPKYAYLLVRVNSYVNYKLRNKPHSILVKDI